MPEESLQRQWLYQVRLEPLCLMLVIKGEDMFDVMRESEILTVRIKLSCSALTTKL